MSKRAAIEIIGGGSNSVTNNTVIGGDSLVSIQQSTGNLVKDNLLVSSAALELFAELEKCIHQLDVGQSEKESLRQSLSALRSRRDRATWLENYHRFIESAAVHMTVFAPFLPALHALMGKI